MKYPQPLNVSYRRQTIKLAVGAMTASPLHTFCKSFSSMWIFFYLAHDLVDLELSIFINFLYLINILINISFNPFMPAGNKKVTHT